MAQKVTFKISFSQAYIFLYIISNSLQTIYFINKETDTNIAVWIFIAHALFHEINVSNLCTISNELVRLKSSISHTEASIWDKGLVASSSQKLLITGKKIIFDKGKIYVMVVCHLGKILE